VKHYKGSVIGTSCIVRGKKIATKKGTPFGVLKRESNGTKSLIAQASGELGTTLDAESILTTVG
jgi:hypothetical protein